MTDKKMVLVIPCYNETEVLSKTANQHLNKLKELILSGKISDNSKILYVNDGSADDTWSKICKLSVENKYIQGISLSRNMGHQNALWAGLMDVKNKCDFTISIDCDGQDDINAVDSMIDEYNKGFDIVYGVRNKRKKDTFLKRFTAQKYYSFLKHLGVNVINNHADFRLLSNKIINELQDFHEVNLYLRGLVPLIGYESTCVYYERERRLCGKSHYSIKKMFKLAIDGITSLSIKPVFIIMFGGIILTALSMAGLIGAAVMALLGIGDSIVVSLISALLMLFGLQFTAIGVVGVYVGKTYMETKARPRYIISNRTKSGE